MKRVRSVLACALTCAGITTAALAGSPVQREMTCAVGGEEFTHTTTASYSTWGARPDGKPYGSWTFPMPLPVCPGNGLVMYRAFTAEEVEALQGYVAGEAYAGLRSETPYFRASRIEDHLGADSGLTPIYLLMRAAWETDNDGERKARYQREFAERVTALPAETSDRNWLFLMARAANARRELGEFAQAAEVLESIGPVSAESVAWDDNMAERQRERWMRGWEDYTNGLAALIAEGNSESEPLAMLPPRMAAWICIEKEEAGEALPAPCSSPDIVDELRTQREMRAMVGDAEANADTAAQ